MDTIKITYLLTQSLDSPSGLGRYGPLARELTKLGHQIEIFALHPNFTALENPSFKDRGVQVNYLAPMHVQKIGVTKKYYPTLHLLPIIFKATTRLTRSSLKTDADIIHIGKPHPMNGIAGLAAKYLRNKRIFLDCDDIEVASNRFSGEWQKMVIDYFENLLPARAHRITTNTDYQRRRLLAKNFSPERVIYLPNGVESDRFISYNQLELESIRADLQLSDKKVIAFIGSLSLSSHPVDLLIDAFQYVYTAESDAILIIVGAGEDFQNLQHKVHLSGLDHAVRFTGKIQPEKVGLYYRMANVIADPVYDNEAARGRCPLKMFESWICEVPFVSSDVGDRKKLMGIPQAGVLASPGNPDALAEAILNVLNDPYYGKTLTEIGKKRVKEYDWAVLAKKMEAEYLNYIRKSNLQ